MPRARNLKEAYSEQALVIARNIGERGSEGKAFCHLGNAYVGLGDVRMAIDYYELALTIAREIGDRRGEGNALWNTSLALVSLDGRSEAIKNAKRALKIYRQIESPYAEQAKKKLAQWQGDDPQK